MNPTPSNYQSISPRELEIVRLLAKGMQSKEIADILYISKHTVDTHRRNLLKKTNTKSTLEMIMSCIKKDIL